MPSWNTRAAPAVEAIPSHAPRWTAIAAAAFATAVALTVARHLLAPLFLDFGAAIFYPARAFLDGGSPYDQAPYLATYPAHAPFPYPPGVLLLALPFGLPSLAVARAVYFVLSLLLLPALAGLALILAQARVTTARVLGIAAFILVTRPGHMVIVQGQPSLAFIVAAYAALALSTAPENPADWRRRRFWGAAVMLAVTLGKPTIGGPLAVLWMTRGRVRLVAASIAVAVALSLVLVPPLAARAGGLGTLLHQMTANEESWTVANDNEPVTSVYRLDAIALTSRFVGHSLTGPAAAVLGLAILALGAAGVRRFDRAGDPTNACALLCLTTVACMYHQTYDALLLIQASVALATIGERREPRALEVPAPLRLVLLALLAVPLLNHAATHAVASRLALDSWAWLLVTSASGGAIFVAFVIYLVLAARAVPRAATRLAA